MPVHPDSKGLSAASVALFILSSSALAQECLGPSDIALVNGNVLTMDADGSVAQAVRVIGDEIVLVGANVSIGPCTQEIDLAGHTVIPGLIDTHAHFTHAALRPGNEAKEIENATSIDEVGQAIRERAVGLPKGEWITAFGGWMPVQLAEGRAPTLQELDAFAPNHPVFLQWNAFFGPSVTNSLGREFLESRNIDVADDGMVAAVDPTFSAFLEIDSLDSFEDKLQSTRNVQRYAASLGLTNVFETGGGHHPDNPPARFMDPLRDNDALVEVWRRGDPVIRVRILYSNEDGPDLSKLRARLDNAYPDLGDDWLRTAGYGEHILRYPVESFRNVEPGATPAFEGKEEGYDGWYEEAVRLLAEQGWTHTQHSLTQDENDLHLDTWERVNEQLPIADLRWSLAHGWYLSEENLDRLVTLGASFTTNNPYLWGAPTPYRTALEKGIVVGAGTDSPSVGPLNPWLNIYFMVTGLTAGGNPVNVDETVSPLDALRMYTINAAWHSKEEDKLGSIEVGKLADLVVLTEDPRVASPEDLKQIRSRLTIIDGIPVYTDGTLLSCEGANAEGRWYGSRTADVQCAVIR